MKTLTEHKGSRLAEIIIADALEFAGALQRIVRAAAETGVVVVEDCDPEGRQPYRLVLSLWAARLKLCMASVLVTEEGVEWQHEGRRWRVRFRV